MPFDAPMLFGGFVPSRRSLLLGAAALSLAGRAAAQTSANASAGRFAGIQAVLDAYAADGRLPGVTVGLTIPGGERVYLQAGSQDYGASPAMDRQTLFRIYSMTKPITGAAAALLMEDGRLALDQPVTDFVPEFAHLTVAVDPDKSLEARPVTQVMTIRHLLTHTAGFSYSIMGDGPIEQAYRREGIVPVTGDLGAAPEDGPKVRDLDEMVARLGRIPLRSEPGSKWFYSVSIDVLGLVIQRASGMAFPDFLQRRLLDPIGMTDTIWRLRPGDTARLAALYNYEHGGRRLDEGAAPANYAAPITLYPGGAGLVSTTRDYLAFMTTILDDGQAGAVRVMKPETARLIRSDILPPGTELLWNPGDGFGFGGVVVRPPKPDAGSFGWSGAAGTNAWIDPAHDLAVVIMVQHFEGQYPIVEEVRAALALDLARSA